MEYRLNIRTDNAAFEEAPRVELARILRVAAAQIEAGVPLDQAVSLLDANGNRVGQHKLHEEEFGLT